MIKKETLEHSKERFGGHGELDLYWTLNEEDLCHKGKGMLRIVLPPGSSIGYHQHQGNFEVYYILSGSGIFNDNGTEKPIQAGEAGVIRPGEFHALENTGSQEMTLIAVVINE